MAFHIRGGSVAEQTYEMPHRVGACAISNRRGYIRNSKPRNDETIQVGTDETVDNETENRRDQTLGKPESIREDEGDCRCRIYSRTTTSTVMEVRGYFVEM